MLFSSLCSKRFKLFTTIHDEGSFLPIDITSFPWVIDQNDALIFFSKLARDFGADFPTFLIREVSSFNGEFYNMTDVTSFVNSLFNRGEVLNMI